MAWFEQLEKHLRDLYLNSSSHDVDAFKPAFHSFFSEEHQTFRLKMFHNLDQLRLQLERANLLEVNPRTCLEALRTQFKEFFASKRVNSSEHLNQCWQKDFKEYTFCEPDTYRRDLLENLDTLEMVIHRAVITYGRLQLQSQDVQINPVQAVDDRLSVSKSSWIESENNNALSKLVNETQLQQHESLVTESTTLEANLSIDVNALDVGMAVTESNGTNSYKQDTSSNSRNYLTHVVDADIRPVNDQVLFAEIDSNTTPDLTNMCHRGGEIDQDAEQYQIKNPLLNAEFFKTKDMDSPEFCEFFEINELKARLQAKNTMINNLKKQIKNVHEKSNEAKVKHDIDVIETITIELEHKMAKLLKENKTLKKHYKDLYDFIKVARTKTIKQTTSLIAKNDEFKAQLQEKGFTIAALKNELRKLTGNSMNTKFAKPSILGKPVLQPLRKPILVRQLTVFRSERPKVSKPRFASQVDANNVLSKPVTPYYSPKVRESVFVKPNHVIASASSRNSS
ncbi:hypothetical protein Tco_0066974 [Tanacetum coccineum]